MYEANPVMMLDPQARLDGAIIGYVLLLVRQIHTDVVLAAGDVITLDMVLPLLRWQVGMFY
jgi:hypothetical protein